VIPYRVAGVRSGRETYGHRAYQPEAVILSHPAGYEEKLLASSVIADRGRRKENIKGQVAELCGSRSRELEVPEVALKLYELNTDLTELPIAVLCEFDEVFLDLPAEVLTSEMIEHQHYFPLVYKDTKKLSHYFIVISNIRDNSESIYGYKRVLRARLDDGKFFYNEDKKQDLRSLLSKLQKVTFHEKLGSMYQKVERIGKISEALGSLLCLDEGVILSVDEVVHLCKNDLSTLMVAEFPHLQGIMGFYYALSSGHRENIAVGIKEHYFPRFSNDVLPLNIEGAVVGMADRLDTIVGIFSIGLRPKGSKDPFGLRRKVLAIIRIVINLHLHFSFSSLLSDILPLYTLNNEPETCREIETFFINRIKSIFNEMGFSYDEIDASLAGLLDDVYESYRRVFALHELRGNKDFDDLLISFKRMSNITKGEKTCGFSEDLLREVHEKELYRHFMTVKENILKSIECKEYGEVYRILSTFKPFVDNFFDHVLVMDKNRSLRKNRIGLLNKIINIFSDIIDFSRIVQSGE